MGHKPWQSLQARSFCNVFIISSSTKAWYYMTVDLNFRWKKNYSRYLFFCTASFSFTQNNQFISCISRSSEVLDCCHASFGCRCTSLQMNLCFNWQFRAMAAWCDLLVLCCRNREMSFRIWIDLFLKSRGMFYRYLVWALRISTQYLQLTYAQAVR